MQISKLFIILTIILSSAELIAAPTVEGLLRGGQNPENIYDWSVFRLRLKKPKTFSIDEEGLKTEVIQAGEEEINEKNIKILFSTNLDEPIKFIQIEYETAGMRKDGILKVTSSKDLLKDFAEDNFQERVLFYGLLISLSAGNSSLLDSLLIKFNKDYRSNKLLLNEEKVDLYEEYKKYLAAIKEDPDLEQTLESPLQPTDVVKMTEVQKLIKQEMYKDLNQVKIQNIGNRYFWQAKLENFEANFTLNDHRLRKLSLTTPQGVITAGAKNYRVFSSNFNLPGVITIKDVLEETYEVTIKQYQQFGKTKLHFDDLLKKYEVKKTVAEKVTKVESKDQVNPETPVEPQISETETAISEELQEPVIKEKYNIIL